MCFLENVLDGIQIFNIFIDAVQSIMLRCRQANNGVHGLEKKIKISRKYSNIKTSKAEVIYFATLTSDYLNWN